MRMCVCTGCVKNLFLLHTNQTAALSDPYTGIHNNTIPPSPPTNEHVYVSLYSKCICVCMCMCLCCV